MATRKGEIQALITLIDDPDETVYSQVRERIVELGDSMVPELEQAWEDEDLGDLFRNRIEDLLHHIHISSVTKRLEVWRDAGGENLLEGTLIVSRYRYPDLDEGKVKARLAALRQQILLKLNDNLTAFEKVRVLNYIFFDLHGFDGDKRNYHAPKNNFINEVLETHKGNPLSLAITYQILAQDLNLPIYGVNLPNHFVLAYMDEEGLGGEDPLFYINAFSRGDILGRNEINEFLAKLKIKPQPSFYAPCTNIDSIRRQLNNLANSYEKNGDQARFDEVKMLRDLLGKPDGIS